MKSIIESVRQMLRECPFLSDFSKNFLDYTERDEPGNYGIFPTGEVLLWEDMRGNSRWQYNFVLQAVNWTPENEERLKNSEFVERLCQWFYDQSRTVTDFPVDVLSMSAQNGQFVEASADGNAGVYQIPCNLIYEKEA